ncbi:hypothetical protein J5N97_010482 [Dioscorea zingiberensis]|uniref:Amine oxidase domain-containing protein n=1 Tax=Dioscorea zingiberensis TaxID=325984 RepID=A0A9D5D0P7_9LILI|nr:hypothetical protein J5N97_010482 [Dioscorea zingiberensis]
MAQELHLRNFYSNYDNISLNCYKEGGGLYHSTVVDKAIGTVDEVENSGANLSSSLPSSGRDDISLLTMQRLMNRVPSDPVEMVIDYYTYDYEFAEPPRVTSMQNTVPLATFANFGEDLHFVADQRGYESLVYHLAYQFLKTDKQENIVDPRLMLNKVVRRINYSSSGATVTTEDGKSYKADYVMVSVSIGVLQTTLIKFQPTLPHFEKQYPGAHVLQVTVTDEESRRIEQQSDSETKAETMKVLRKMFGKNIPEATDIFVPRWWSDRHLLEGFTFTGEHTSEHYNGYVHGAYIAGIDSANMMIRCIKRGSCKFKIKAKDAGIVS